MSKIKDNKIIAEELFKVLHEGSKGLSAEGRSAEVDDFFTSNKFSGELAQMLSEKEVLRDKLDMYNAIDTAESLRRLKMKQMKRTRRRLLARVSGVACAAAVFFVSFLVYNNSEEVLTIAEHSREGKLLSLENVSRPTLVTNNGASITLDNNKVIRQSDVHELAKNVVETSDEGVEPVLAAVREETLLVPKGTRYTIILDDGTEVIINAGSTFTFPSRFSDSLRKVTLSGEAYFKVAKSDVPFVADVNSITHRVYGTEFNINSFNPESIKTVLVSGSIGVAVAGEKETMLVPYEMIDINAQTGSSTKTKVEDISLYLSWLDNTFSYENEPISSVLKDVSLWYGVNVTTNTKSNARITGEFNRDKKLDDIIHALEELTDIKINYKE